VTVRHLTPAEILYLHHRLIESTGAGGAQGIRDMGLLLAAVERPKAGLGGKEVYPDLCTKAAALLESLCRNHPFLDGNKRVTYAAAGLFLAENGYRLRPDPAAETLVLRVAQGETSLSEIAAYLRKQSRRRKRTSRR
jgi:death-on-curing protein